MKISIQNLGAIEKADIDLCKKLIVFCGPNGTGKTYISYVIYGYAKLVMGPLSNLFKLQDLIEKKEVVFELDYKSLFDLQNNSFKFLKDNISSEFASNKFLFTNFDIKLIIPLEEFRNNLFQSALSYDYEFGGISLHLAKESRSNSVKINLIKPLDLSIKRDDFTGVVINAYLSKYLFNSTILYSYILPVERNSVYTFSKELSLKRLRKSNDNIEESAEVQERMTRYPRAIIDALTVAEDLANIKKKKSEFHILADVIENEILHGKISISDQGEVQFSPDNASDVVLPVHLSASLIKTLSGLIIYLRHQANLNDLIIIDEPELNLHPDNQIRLARIIARLINAGFRIIISTHSDYIIRELNNLIMLSSDKTEIKEIAKRNKYKNDEMILPEKVGAYLFNFNSNDNTKVIVENLTVDENGFEVKTIDDAINKLNDISDDLFDALKYSENADS